MEITLESKDKKDKKIFTFPTLPESINLGRATRYQSYEIMNIGAVKFPKGNEVGTISWSGIFFGKSKESEKSIINGGPWESPNSCRKMLGTWRKKGTVLTLKAAKLGINYEVTIESFSGAYKGAFGNYEYSISFARCTELKVFTTDELKIKSNRSTKPKAKTYKVVSGDSLWKIAASKLGKGSRWTEIYKLNKAVIEKSAKKHGKSSSSNGHWIYPGDIYTLPKA